MVFHNFDELIAHVKGQPSRARMAVAAAGDAHTIEAVLRARAEGIVTPILVGDKAVIDQVLAELGCEGIPQLTVYNKCDKAGATPFDPAVILTSAKTGQGLDDLLAALDAASPAPPRRTPLDIV